MFKEALAHFEKADPVMYTAAKGIKPPVLKKSEDPFYDLCEAIVMQQLSDKAGSIIFSRFKALFRKGKITPKKLLEIPTDEIRKCGISFAKVSYLKELAKFVIAERIALEELENMPDAKVMECLMKVKGIGPWTAEMFLMFSLARPDVFSHGDLGLKKGIMKLHGMKEEPSKREVEKIVSKWSPYRTYASMVLWRIQDK